MKKNKVFILCLIGIPLLLYGCMTLMKLFPMILLMVGYGILIGGVGISIAVFSALISEELGD